MRLEEIITQINNLQSKIKTEDNVLKLNKIKEEYLKLYEEFKKQLNKEKFDNKNLDTIIIIFENLHKSFLNSIEIKNIINNYKLTRLN